MLISSTASGAGLPQNPIFAPMPEITPNTWITGATGQTGQCLRDSLANHSEIRAVFTGREDVNLADEGQVKEFITERGIQVLIHTAAYTAVDRAEDEASVALQVNADIPQILAEACRQKGVPMIHVSTDYVFDGTSDRPYAESDTENPQSQYGLSKWLGELEVLQASPGNAVVRTSWLYSEYGHNFVKTMLRLGAEKESLRVVNDQHGCPTYARDLAEALLTMAAKLHANPGQFGGIYHFANAGATTWFEFASEIMKQAGLPCEVLPCTTEDYPTKAVRPAYSVLDTRKIQTTFGLEIRDWKSALADALSKLKNS